MGRQLLADAADVGQLLQVGVHLLVARHGQQHVVRHALGIRAVALQNPRGDLQQRDVAHVAGLLARLADPAVALHVGDDVLGCELLDVREGQPREAAEDEEVARLGQPRDVDLLVHQPFDLRLFGHLALDGLQREADLGEGVALHPLAGQRNAGDLLEVLEVLRRRVVAAAAVGFQVELELLDETAVDFVQIEVVAVVGVAHELLREFHAGLVAFGGGSGQIDAHQLVAFVVVLAEELEERVAVRGLAAEVEVQHLLGCEGLLVHLQVAVDADDAGPHGVDVEVDGLAERGAGRCLAADGVPLIGEDALADGGVGALAVDRDADAHGDLPVLVGSRPTHVERDPKSTFLSIHILHVLTGCKFTPPCAILEYAKCRESANKNLSAVAESGADGHATELPAEELPQGGVFVRPRKTKIPVSELLTGIMGFLSNPLCGERGIRTPGTVARTPHFECGPIDHSGISPFSVAGEGPASRPPGSKTVVLGLQI